MQRAVFLDRDGVINRAEVRCGKPYPPANLSDVEIIPGVSEALLRLHEAGFILVVVTNQPDVARGTASIADVEEINCFLKRGLPIDEFRTCYHDSGDNCHCRKPLPGAIFAAASKYEISLDNSYMVGDRWRDIEAGQRAGCITIFINYNYAEQQPQSFDYCVKSLIEASRIILEDRK